MKKTFFFIFCSSVLAFVLGYCGIGSDLKIVKTDGVGDCFVNGNPAGMALYGDYSLFAKILSAGSPEEIGKGKSQMLFFAQAQLDIIEEIGEKYGVEEQKVNQLKMEIEDRCSLYERP